jgi:ubiquinone biosynthesis protein
MKLFGGYLRQMPHMAHGLFKRLATEPPKIELSHTGLEDTSKKFENSINRLTLGLVVAASLIAASLILNSTRKVLLFEVDFFGVQTLSMTDVLGFSGYIIATFLGLWLVYSIVRSGKLSHTMLPLTVCLDWVVVTMNLPGPAVVSNALDLNNGCAHAA